MMKHYAFISYSHSDVKEAKWLQKRLESYRLPTKIQNEFEDSRYLRPVFRDQTDLNTGILRQELKQHLSSSKFLVIICSPSSAKSQWVNREVMAFIEWGRLDHIIPFIIDGTPNSIEDECFPEALRKLSCDEELLGINLKESGREQAFIRVVSRMLGVDFDVLWQRQCRRKIRRIVISCITVPLIVFAVGWAAIPLTLRVTLRDDAHPSLPMPDDAVLTVGNTDYRLTNLDTTIIVTNLPGYFRKRILPISFKATFYDTLRVNTCLGYMLANNTTLQLVRDRSFAIFAGIVTDEEGHPIAEANIKVGDKDSTTDKDGYFFLLFTLDNQSETKNIVITKQGYQPIQRQDECPNEDLRYVMRKQS